ncbi:MAG: NAD(+) synthase [Planctomycetota bacterium]
MKKIRVGACVLNQTPLDWDANVENILGAIRQAREEGVSLLCLPELCISGYGCEDAFFSASVLETSKDLILEIVPETEGIAVCVGLPLRHRGALYNVACLIADRRILGFVAKRFLAGEGIHYEPRWFRAWPAGERSTTEVGGEEYPLGDLHFEIGGVVVGFEICEDAWVASRPGADLASRSVDVVMNPSASHFAFDKIQVRRRFVTEGSRAFSATYVYSNLLGNEAGRAIYDGGALVASAGRLVAQGPRFSMEPRVLTSAVIDLDETRGQRARVASFEPDVSARESGIVTDYSWPTAVASDSGAAQPATWESSENLSEEEFTRAITLALLDYVRKSRARGYVVSLSGGADSCACACLVSMMVQRLLGERGQEGVRSALSHVWPDGEVPNDLEQLTSDLLLCVYQGTRNSSETTRAAAETIAGAIHASYLELDVDGIVEGFTSIVSDAIGRELSWEADDLALQNIQARARSPGVWLLANLRGAVLVSTSNRSEAAVGYATMDGDTSGGLSPIAGIDKAFLRTWLRWLEEQGAEGLGAIPALRVVNEQAPTAELRPAESEQTDEGDLMSYEVLDAIEKAAIRDKKSPVEVFHTLRESDPSLSPEQLRRDVEKFFRLWSRNQWKRERYAPSFHVDDENLDPKTWCRFPILSGGFERELRELNALDLSRAQSSGRH